MSDYPGIKRATLLITVDNGGLHRDRSEAQIDKQYRAFIEKRPPEMLEPIDTWLNALSDEQLDVICCGEHTEAQAALSGAPAFTDELLNDYFDKVC